MHQIVAPRDLELYTAPKPTDKRLARTGGRVDKGAKLTIVGASIRQGHKGSAASVSHIALELEKPAKHFVFAEDLDAELITTCVSWSHLYANRNRHDRLDAIESAIADRLGTYLKEGEFAFDGAHFALRHR